ncbi:MAG: hypothetical protein WC775_02400 [Patescibacteria group bacterium]|jgi:hypothetical protein
MDKDINEPKTPRVSMLLLLFAAVILVPLLLVMLSKSSFKSKSKAASCDLVAGCADQNGACVGAAGTVVINGKTYACRGKNQWTGPNGEALSSLPGTMKQEFKITVPTEGAPNKDNLAGCVFSFRFDKDAAVVDLSMKDSAFSSFKIIKELLAKGTEPSEVLFVIQNGVTKSELNQLKTDFMKSHLPFTSFKLPENQFAKFRTSNSPNFCFTNSDSRFARLGMFFLSANPSFDKQLTSLEVKGSSDPFVIYQRNEAGDVTEYGWMVIARTQ